jgi:flagellar biosynthesis regulator FlaF
MNTQLQQAKPRKTKAQARVERLQRLAKKAAEAMYAFRDALEATQANEKLWQRICDECDVSPDSTESDWLA